MSARIDVTQTCALLKNWMQWKDVSAKKLQDVCGVSHQSVYAWLNAKSLPSIDNLVLIAEILECKIDDILYIKKMDE